MTYTHFLRFDDEASAKAALPHLWFPDEQTWRRDIVDGPIIGEGWTGYHLNIGLQEKDTSMPGLIGVWYDGHLVHGDQPATPAVTF